MRLVSKKQHTLHKCNCGCQKDLNTFSLQRIVDFSIVSKENNTSFDKFETIFNFKNDTLIDETEECLRRYIFLN